MSGSCFPVHLKSLQCFCVCDLAVEVSMSLTWCWLASLVPPELSSCVCVATTQGDEATNQVPPGLCKYRPKWRFWSRVRNKQVDVEKHCLSPLLWVLVICLPPCSLLPNSSSHKQLLLAPAGEEPAAVLMCLPIFIISPCLCCSHPFCSCSSTAFCFLCSQH